ncbi:MAG: FprA family A-type flavoprotein, partial [Kiritimatiellia bacterium]|nr:FprA family A-type flavoprotein [Kiritimatiellia bacterium]
MKTRKICNGVHWMGAIDWNRRLFDSLIPLPDGTSYNAYLVCGSEKTVLLDTVDPALGSVLREQLATVERVDYIVSHHAEQDHSGSLPWVLEKYPAAQVLCSAKAKPMLIEHLNLAPDRIRIVEDGEALPLGGKTLRFYSMPWVHWPETM